MIDTVLAEINKPIPQRRFINGPIDYGNGGFNYNANHTFLWRHIPDQWTLVVAAIEVCDGCPFSDLDSNPTYFVDTIRTYCPWIGYPKREIPKPTSLDRDLSNEIKIYPNPSDDFVTIEFFQKKEYSIDIFSLQSSLPIVSVITKGKYQLAISDLKPGLYLVQINTKDSFAIKKISVF